MVAGTSIAIDSSSVSLLLSVTQGIPVDFVSVDSAFPLFVNDSDFIDPLENLKKVEHVEDATFLASIGGWEYAALVDTPLHTQDKDIIFLPSDSQGFLNRFGIVGELPGPGTAAISKRIAAELEIGIGDQVECSYAVDDTTYFNVSFEVSSIWGQSADLFSGSSYGMVPPPGTVAVGYSYREEAMGVAFEESQWHVNPLVLNMADANSVLAEMNASLPPGHMTSRALELFVWIDRRSVFEGGSVESSIGRIGELHSSLDVAGEQYGLEFRDSALSVPLETGAATTVWTRMIFIGLSLPVVAVGVYLSVVGVELGMTERRLEVGILKSRGASGRQILASLLLESSLLGFVGGIIGLLVGAFMSRMLLAPATSFLTDGIYGSSPNSILITPFSVLSAVLLGVGLLLLSSYVPMKRVSAIPITDALRFHAASDERTEYKARLDIALIALVVLCVISVFMVRVESLLTVNSVSTSMALYMLWSLGIAVTPVVPFVLSFSVVRLLTRGTKRLYSWFTPVVRPWTRNLHYIVERNILRNPRRASSLCAFVAMTLAFGVFISVAMESSIAHERAAVVFEAGADLKAEAYLQYSSQEVNFSVLDGIEQMPGVAGVCIFYAVNLYDDYWHSGSWGNAMALDCPAYVEVARYLGDSEGKTINRLEENGTVLAREDYAKEAGVDVGDAIQVQFQRYYGTDVTSVGLQLNVVGTFGVLPGLSGVNYILNQSSIDFIPDYEMQSSYVGMFVDVEEGNDVRPVADMTAEYFAEAGFNMVAGWSVIILDEEMDALYEDPQFGALRSFLYSEYGLSLLTMTIGVGLVVFVAVSDRDRELSAIMARGASTSQMRKILMGETTALMVMGMLVGAVAGFFSAYLFISAMMSNDQSGVPWELALSASTLLVLLVTAISFILSSFMATHRLSKMRLAEVLRIRGG